MEKSTYHEGMRELQDLRETRALADRLEGLLPKLRGGDYRQRTEQFIAGLRVHR